MPARTVPGHPSRSRLRRWSWRLGVALTAAAVVAGGGLVSPPSASAAPPTPALGPDIEDLSPYQPQMSCDPTAKPGVVAFRTLALASYPGSGDDGITRACDQGATSEHKEGRAFDWLVRYDVPAERAMATDMLTWLLATDRYGNRAAMARRLGVMYIIWNHQIWGSYAADAGWKPYSGADPHTGHVHLSFGWAGALGLTSYWTGVVSPVVPPPGMPAPVSVQVVMPPLPAYVPQRTGRLRAPGAGPTDRSPRVRRLQQLPAAGAQFEPR